jgi:hypothetical protein
VEAPSLKTKVLKCQKYLKVLVLRRFLCLHVHFVPQWWLWKMLTMHITQLGTFWGRRLVAFPTASFPILWDVVGDECDSKNEGRGMRKRLIQWPVTTVCPYKDSLFQIHIMGISFCICTVKKKSAIRLYLCCYSQKQNFIFIYTSH